MNIRIGTDIKSLPRVEIIKAEKEMNRFYEKYVRTLKLKVDSEGRFRVIRTEE